MHPTPAGGDLSVSVVGQFEGGGPCHGDNQATGREMTLTATDPAMGGPNGAAHGGPTARLGGPDRWETSPTTNPSLGARATSAVRNVLIYDPRPDARVALTRKVSGAVPSISDITCTASPAELIAAFAERPADLVFIQVQHGRDTAGLFLRRYPTASVIVFGAVADAPALTAALSRGAIGLMLWDPWPDRSPIQGSHHRRLNGDLEQQITRIERRILLGISRGLSNRDIGLRLDISEDAVKTKTRVLYRKLGARDRAHAVALALRRQLLL